MLTRIGVQRDYFWNLSRAILLARETIQIHDWWLSPGMLPFLVLMHCRFILIPLPPFRTADAKAAQGQVPAG